MVVMCKRVGQVLVGCGRVNEEDMCELGQV